VPEVRDYCSSSHQRPQHPTEALVEVRAVGPHVGAISAAQATAAPRAAGGSRARLRRLARQLVAHAAVRDARSVLPAGLHRDLQHLLRARARAPSPKRMSQHSKPLHPHTMHP